MTCVPADTYDRLLDYLDRLGQAGLHFRLARARSDALMVEVSVPGQHWEIEFMRDGTVEVERYVSAAGVEADTALLDRLITDFAD